MGAPRAWGKKLPDYSTLSSPRHGLAGAEADEAVGTYSFGARTYDPTLRRWVSPDPLLAALPSLDESIGDNLNLYAYAGNNPVARIDLTGFEGTSIWERALTASREVSRVIAALDPRAPLRAIARDSVELAQAATQEGAKLTAGGVVRGALEATADKVENEAPLVAAAVHASGAVPGPLAGAVPKGDPKDVGPLVGKAIVNHVLPIVGAARATIGGGGGKAPAPNGGNGKPHGGATHNKAIDQKIQQLKNDPSVTNIRKNQTQVDAAGNKVGRNRPDVQYDKDGCHNCVEFDTVPSNGKRHEAVIRNNDPKANVELKTP